MTNLMRAVVTLSFAFTLVAQANNGTSGGGTVGSGATGTGNGTGTVQPPATNPPAPAAPGTDPTFGRQGSEAGPDTNAATLDNETIRSAQDALGSRGFPTVTDGVLGPNTQNAILRFQGQNGLPQTGQLDEATLEALGVSTGAPGAGTTTAPLSTPDTLPGNDRPPNEIPEDDSQLPDEMDDVEEMDDMDDMDDAEEVDSDSL